MKVHGAAGEASPRYDSEGEGDDTSSAGSVSVTAGAASPAAPLPPPPAPIHPHHSHHHPSITDKLESLNDKYLNPHDQKPYEKHYDRPPAPPHHNQPPHLTNIGGNGVVDNKIGFGGHWTQFQQPTAAMPHGVPDWWCPTQESYHHHHLMHHSGAAAAY